MVEGVPKFSLFNVSVAEAMVSVKDLSTIDVEENLLVSINFPFESMSRTWSGFSLRLSGVISFC